MRRLSGCAIDLDRDQPFLRLQGSLKESVQAAQLVARKLEGRTTTAERLEALLREEVGFRCFSGLCEASLTMLLPADAVNRVPRQRLQQVELISGSRLEVDGLGGRTSGLQQLQIVGTRKGNSMAILHLQDPKLQRNAHM